MRTLGPSPLWAEIRGKFAGWPNDLEPADGQKHRHKEGSYNNALQSLALSVTKRPEDNLTDSAHPGGPSAPRAGDPRRKKHCQKVAEKIWLLELATLGCTVVGLRGVTAGFAV